ncbi:methyltransferase [Ectothiorhodospira mobilis]|uniref:methyltransferase n=1 Tax=Ectothiorhodospira mobilis TaxID=195064 RepID=UPI001EE788FE|nr:methyltransferase [Ectothiorhodospira mobilis]MCG5535089.1 methyltransferase [Ectothiorhodospira mobilis]
MQRPARGRVQDVPSKARWRGGLLHLSNRILASRRFQRWAAAFPLTRPVARRRSRALFDLVAGFVYSQVLYVCVRLDVLGHVHREGPQTPAQLAAWMEMPEENALVLVKAACALGLLQPFGRGRYGLGMHGAAMMAHPGIPAMVAHHAMLYDDLRDPVALFRGEAGETRLGAYWAYAGGRSPAELAGDQVTPYTELMSVSQQLVAEEILDAFTPRGYRRLMDLGGGNATFLTAVGARVPEIQLVLYDLPAVAEQGRRRLESAGLGARARIVRGDFFRDPLPPGADLISLVRVVHDHDDADILGLLRAARQALEPGGALLLAEPMAGTPGAEPMGDAYFGVYLFAMGSGRPRTPGELEDLLRRAGFSQVRLLSTRNPLLTRVMLAEP